jgi:hypothetical protein
MYFVILRKKKGLLTLVIFKEITVPPASRPSARWSLAG